jgi:predicted secreted protein
MPTRKQRRRAQKERRHEYETVWVDGEGNELDEPPEDLVASSTTKRTNGKPAAKAQPQRGGRAGRAPQPPSWQRAARRSAILGAVIFALFYILGSKNGSHHVASALALAAIYTALFIPFTYVIDRFSYNRWQRRVEQQEDKRRQARKR